MSNLGQRLVGAIRRPAARDGLLDFTRYTFPRYRPGTHHRVIADALDRVVRGEVQRLMIFAPPRHGKSELVSRRLPAYYLGKYPDRQVICAAYGDVLVSEFGRDVRNLVASSEYRELFPDTQLAPDSQAKDRWHVAGRSGAYVAVGVGSGVTGRGAHLLVIDDPVKDRKAADSEGQREDIWSWFRAVAYTRLEDNAAIVLTLTRWHEDDLAGKLLMAEENGGEKWEKVILPAVNDDDEALWPAKYSREVLEQIRATIGEHEWASLYQQRPAPLEGALFKPDQLQVIDAEPADVKKWVRAWDLGASARGDPTAGVKIGDWNGRRVVSDVVRLQGSPDQVERAITATASRDGRECEIHLPQDPGQAGVAQVQYLTSKLSGYRVKSSPESGDKVTRAGPFASQVNVGNVYLVRATWNRVFIEELRAFPNSKHDDQVDAASRAFSALINVRKSFFDMELDDLDAGIRALQAGSGWRP